MAKMISGPSCCFMKVDMGDFNNAGMHVECFCIDN